MGRYSYAASAGNARGEEAAGGGDPARRAEQEDGREKEKPPQEKAQGKEAEDGRGGDEALAPFPLPSDAVFDTTSQDEALLTRLLAGGAGGDDGSQPARSPAGADLGFLQRSAPPQRGSRRTHGHASRRGQETGAKHASPALPSHAVFMRSLREAVGQGRDDLVYGCDNAMHAPLRRARDGRHIRLFRWRRVLTSVPAKSLKKLFKVGGLGCCLVGRRRPPVVTPRATPRVQAALTDELLLVVARALQAQPARDTAEAAADELQLLRSLAAVDRFGVCLEFAGEEAKQALAGRVSELLPHLRGAKRKEAARELVERLQGGP